ncbi:MAG: hypothetical protein U0231_01110 [Nitrospiraceae bacterium]
MHSQLWLPGGQEPGQNGDNSWHSAWLWQEQCVTWNGTWYAQRFGGNAGIGPRLIGTNSQWVLPTGHELGNNVVNG